MADILAGIAWRQLEAYRNVAENWTIKQDGRAQRCGECDQCIWFDSDPQGEIYQYTGEQLLALIVAHIRQAHAEVVDGND